MSLNKPVQPLCPEIYLGLSLKMGWFVLWKKDYIAGLLTAPKWDLYHYVSLSGGYLEKVTISLFFYYLVLFSPPTEILKKCLSRPPPGNSLPLPHFLCSVLCYLGIFMKEIQGHSASMTFELGVALQAFNLSFPSLRKPGKSLRCLFSVPASLDISQDRSRLQDDKYEPNWRENGKGCLKLY